MALDHILVGVVKVYDVECCKELRSTARDHSINIIHNLFAKFGFKTQLMSNIHIQNWCRKRKYNLVIIPKYKLKFVPMRKNNINNMKEKKIICFSWGF